MKTPASPSGLLLPMASARPQATKPGHVAPSAWAETHPACWRSEAFAEDLMDSLAPSDSGRGQDTVRRRPLLRRALAAVLRR